MKKFLLDPNLTAQENLWAAAHMAVVIVLCARKRRTKLRLSKDEWADLVFRAEFETVCAFMRKIRKTGKLTQRPYNPLKTFFQNVCACAWSVSGHCVEDLIDEIKYKLNVKSIESSSNPGMERAPKIVETLDESRCYLNYYRAGDKFREPKPYKDLSNNLKDKRAREDYRAYVVECELLGVTPIDEFTWRGKNGYIRAFTHKYGTPSLLEQRKTRKREAKRRELNRGKQRKKG